MAKCGVEFCHSTNPSEFYRKWKMECLNTKFFMPFLLCAKYPKAKKIKKLINKITKVIDAVKAYKKLVKYSDKRTIYFHINISFSTVAAIERFFNLT